MSAVELVLLFVTAIVAGSINGAVGSGSLVTLPVLIGFGVAPGTAVTTNTIAMVLSALGGTLAYRKEIATDLPLLRGLLGLSVSGGLLGAVLLITTPAGAIQVVVPVLVVVALLLVVFQPRVARWVRSRSAPESRENPYTSNGLRAGVVGCSIYGGYFAAAQGVLLIGVLGAFTGAPLTRLNGVRNLLTLSVNLMAAAVFTTAFFLGVADVVWAATAALAAGAVIGGYAGGRVARRVPPVVLRGLIVVVALVSLATELFG